MDSYNEFASVYDMFMDNVPYEEWSRYLIGKLKEAGIEDGIILEQSIVTVQFTTFGSLTCCASLEPDPNVYVVFVSFKNCTVLGSILVIRLFSGCLSCIYVMNILYKSSRITYL